MKAVVEYIVQTYGLPGVLIILLAAGVYSLWKMQGTLAAIVKGNVHALEKMEIAITTSTKQNQEFQTRVLNVFERTLLK